MENEKVIAGATEADVKQQLIADLQREEDWQEYRVTIERAGKRVLLEIDIDPGGGFDSGFATTRFSAAVAALADFRLTVHDRGFLDTAGKWLGMEDVEIGYPELDEKLIIKTNDPAKVKALFADGTVQEALRTLTDFKLRLTHGTADEGAENALELLIEEGITDEEKVWSIYAAFYRLLLSVEAEPA